MTMLDPFGKSKRRVQKKYLVCRNGLKFEVIWYDMIYIPHIPHKITSWYQPTINKRKLPRYGRFLWILRLPWERSLSDWSQAESCVRCLVGDVKTYDYSIKKSVAAIAWVCLGPTVRPQSHGLHWMGADSASCLAAVAVVSCEADMSREMIHKSYIYIH